MSWGDINLSELTTEQKTLPEETDFNFELLPGAKFNPWKPSRIDAGAKVIDGEHEGQRIYFSYPDPVENSWVTGVFARMIKALGVPATDGEDPISYLNRAAGAKFVSKVKHRKVDTDGVETVKVEIKIGNVKAYRG
jgi:hypothetical protein